MHTQAGMDGDRRSRTRRRVLQAAKLVFGGGFTVDCAMRDRSETGVRVRASEDVLPREVVLVSMREAKAYVGEVMWRDGDQAGIRLGQAHDLKGPVGAAHAHARALWAENALREFTPEKDTGDLGQSLD